MRADDGRFTFSPSDLTAFLACEHLTALELRVARRQLARPERDDPQAELIRRKGDEHEAAYLQRLLDEGRDVVEIELEEPDGGGTGSAQRARPRTRCAPGATSSTRPASSTAAGGASAPAPYHRPMDLRAELERALALEDDTERKLAVAAVVGEAVRPLGFRAVVIGGLAVEFWTDAAYTTADIDLYLPHGPAIDDALARIGFTKHGRHWVLEGHDVFIEAPASFPSESEEVFEVTLQTGTAALVLAVEDVIVDRLHQFVAGGHSDVLEQAVALLAVHELDYPRLVGRASEEGLEQALIEVERISQRLRRGEVIPSWELHDIARELRRRA